MLRMLGHKLLLLSLALPGASLALGLGDLHVESALHQPLTAQIELVGATQEDLARLSARIADEETFERYGLERPAFLFTTALKISQDKQGHPVLVLRSTDAFTDPVVTFLVDLHSPSGELIREYTLLLDPDGLVPEHINVGSLAVTPEPVLAGDGASAAGTGVSAGVGAAATGLAALAPSPASARVSAPGGKISGQTYTVAPHDTLDRIVSVAGAHTRSDRHRMMIAIFRANPAAFQNNLNRLHIGATLHIPSAAELAAISADDANHEFEAQMAARYAPGHRAAPAAPANAPVIAPEAVPQIATAATNPAADAKPNTEFKETDNAALAQRVEWLERTLGEMKQELKKPRVVQRVAAPAADSARAPTISANDPAPADEAADETADGPAPAPHRGMKWFVPLAVGLGLALAAGVWFYRRRRDAQSLLEEPDKDYDWSTSRETKGVQPVKTGEAITPLSQIASVAGIVVEESDSDAQKPTQGPAENEPNWFKEPASTGSVNPATSAFTPRLPAARTAGVESTLKLALARIHDTESAAKLPTAITAEMDPTEKLPAANFEAAITARLPSAPAYNAATTARLPAAPAYNTSTVRIPAATPSDADTLELLEAKVEMVGDTVDQKFSFFNPESSNNTEHVVMGSALNEPKSFVERRKSPADVLRQAIEREPDRSDLRLKLLELYYTAAAQNRQAFLEVTRQLVKNEKLPSPQEWSQIADMGRTIAPDDKLFSDSLDEQEVA
jgi:FimV-like protein